MYRALFLITVSILASLVFPKVHGQEKKASHRESVFLQAGGGKRLTIEYGRSSPGLTPHGKIWQIGDKGPARLTSEFDFSIGDVLVPEGTYSLFAISSESGWKLIINKIYKAEGFEYDEKEDLGRFDMEISKPSEPVEQLTISIVPGGGGKGKIRIDWEKTSATLPFSVVTY